MTEPATTAAGGLALYKLGALGFLAALLSALVVMAMTLPRTTREFSVALISTVVGSLLGGAFAIRYFELQSWAADDIGLLGLGAVIFTCGLPGWVSVRAWFAYTEARKGRSLIQLIREVRGAVKGES